MEKRVKAFFYDYKYYLFPEDCETLQELKGRTHVRVKWLKEHRCMAPDFIRESIEETELTIEAPQRIFEVYVNLYTSEEYDNILREQVKRVCPGCERYGGDAEDLEGHHVEIALDGTCYIRESKDEYWDFSQCTDIFWYRISKIVNDLAVCIDKGNQKKLNKLINKELTKFCYQVEFYGCVVDGKYCLCIPSVPFMRSSYASICCYLAYAGGQENGDMAKAGWLVKPYRVAGAYRYKGKVKEGKPLFRLVETGSDLQLGVLIYDKHAAKLDNDRAASRLLDVDNYFCSVLGENVVRAVVAGYQFVPSAEELVTPAQAAAALKEKCDTYFAQNGVTDEIPYPMPMPYAADDGAAAVALPLREGVTELITNCPDLSFLDKEGVRDKAANPWLDLLSFGYIYVPRSVDDPDDVLNTVLWYFGNLHDAEPYVNPEETRVSSFMLGFGDCGGEAFVIDVAVTGEKRFYRALRILAPVLMAVGAKLVVVNDEGIMQYTCGYEFTTVS